MVDQVDDRQGLPTRAGSRTSPSGWRYLRRWVARDSLLLRWRPTVRFYFAFDGLVDVSLGKPMGKLNVPGLEGVQHPVTLFQRHLELLAPPRAIKSACFIGMGTLAAALIPRACCFSAHRGQRMNSSFWALHIGNTGMLRSSIEGLTRGAGSDRTS